MSADRRVEQPDYLPASIPEGAPGVALIGCGSISAMHLAAYRDAGLQVLILCDRTLAKAHARRAEFAPAAEVTTDAAEVLGRPDVAVVDIATHVTGRPALIEAALLAGKHVLSQKPFVRDLEEGRRLIRLARAHGRVLAVHHNGRWAPHFAAALALVRRGDIGAVSSADFAVYWPHDRIFADDPHFSTMQDLVIFDFGIHWFDLVAQLFADAGPARRVFASARRRDSARIAVPTDVEVLIDFESAAATLLFRASAAHAESGAFRIEGSEGVVLHAGSSLGGDNVRAVTSAGELVVALDGDWWSRGMLGPMAEVIAAIRAERPPSNDAATALPGLALAFAAQESLRTGAAVDPATVGTGLQSA
ncbi:MAG: dehydrogenase [Naasia sp.]|nr:dehydrogenase [Naasia sp.]